MSYTWGHGAPNAWVGDSLLVYMLTTGNAGLLEDRVCVGLPCCSSGLKLGPKAIRKGARAFVGSRTTMYTAYSEEEHDYQADWFDYTMELYRALLNGATVGEAVERYKAKGRKYLNLYKERMGDWPHVDYYINTTRKNIRFVRSYGDKSATLRLRKERAGTALDVVRGITASLSPTLALAAASVAAPLVKKGIEAAKKKMKGGGKGGSSSCPLCKKG